MSNFLGDGNVYEEAKMLFKDVDKFFQPDIQPIYDTLQRVYQMGYEDGKLSNEK
jgi:hypothetical protein